MSDESNFQVSAQAEIIRSLSERIMRVLVRHHDFDPNYVSLDHDTLEIGYRRTLAAAPKLPGELISAVYGPKLSPEQLAEFMQWLQEWLTASPDAVDDALVAIDLSKAEPTVAVTVARITSPLRSKLRNWKAYVRRLERWLHINNFDASKVLRGLI